MTNILEELRRRIQDESGFVLGRIALVVLILAIIIVAAVIAFLVPN
jgi:hypothetical protein